MIEFTISQIDSLFSNSSCVAIYLVASYYIKSHEVYKCMMAMIACQVYSLSPLYNITLETNPSIVFLIYASIYFTVIRFLISYRVIAGCFIMALFEGLMYKAYLNELGNHGLENWLYSNYESIVTLLHVGIIFQMVQWSRLRSSIRFLRDSLFSPFMHNRLLLPYRG